MDGYTRYGIFVVPEGPFFAAGSAWLGWDSLAGTVVPHPTVAGLPDTAEDLTATPRKYGFHGTVKPPFSLAKGVAVAQLDAATRAFCAAQTSVAIPTLEVRRLGGFVAITPSQACTALADLAADTVEALDPFRAPPSEAELARRRKAGLSPRQEALLQRWGYPFVREEFRFHMTLTGRTAHADAATSALAAHFAPFLQKPLIISSLALMGEGKNGAFHLIQRYPLQG